jgi:pimeloyl-ACP methyl ester carboxylesterase
MVLIIFSAILFSALSFIVVILFRSGKQPQPFLTENGEVIKNSISEKTFIEINGTRQGMFIKSKDSSNPVLLYLHGGMPDYFLDEKYRSGLDEIFTVVWWEQRGSGLSFHPDADSGSVTMDLMISDIIGMTNFLRHKFEKEKIYLMGHSGGTFTGILAASKAPELYHAYIGVAQMSDQVSSEKLAYNHMVEIYRNKGNKKMVKKLLAVPVKDAIPEEYLKIRDIVMHDLGVGTTRDIRSVFTGIFLPSLMCRDYTITEKFNTWYGKARSGVSVLWKEMIITDLRNIVTELKIPVYFFAGNYDYTCSTDLAKSYFEMLVAPVKGLYIFEHSAHSPFYEEPEKTRRILREDVLKGINSLTDQ